MLYASMGEKNSFLLTIGGAKKNGSFLLRIYHLSCHGKNKNLKIYY